jgi:hypothetical protein
MHDRQLHDDHLLVRRELGRGGHALGHPAAAACTMLRPSASQDRSRPAISSAKVRGAGSGWCGSASICAGVSSSSSAVA